ncbi:MAG: methyltransferase domain-containing protein [Candidatus Didemnitutus sp.]|nr:methyltransferase domain-containing protein [Candidatus Didemnitutus sp.]
MSENTAYNPGQIESNYPLGSENYYWFVARNRVLERAIRSVHADGAIFDVGCGRGFTLAHLIAHGFDAWGSDLADYGTPHPRAMGRVFYREPLAQLDAALRHRVTTILLLDVIEHLPQPAEIVAMARAAFPNLRRVIVTVPARTEIWSNYDEYFGHFRRYDQPALREWARVANLEVGRLSYFFHALYWPAWVVARTTRRRSTTVQVPRWPALHQALGGALALEAALLPSGWRGSSLLGIFYTHPESPNP